MSTFRILSLLASLIIFAACSSDDRRQPDMGMNVPDGGGDGGSPDDGGDRDADLPPSPDAGELMWPVATAPITIAADPSWKNRVALDDAFGAGPLLEEFRPPYRWINFVVLMRDPTKVYFQDTVMYPFHFDFATEKLAPFMGLDQAAFDAISLHEMGQDAILGSILISPAKDEYGVQLVRMEPYHPEMARILFELVRSSVDGGGRAYYFPTYEQSESANAFASFFAGHGIELSSSDRWIDSDLCYSDGWALGRLGTDIIVTDSPPESTPYIKGIISTVPSNANSRLANRMKAYGSPFAMIANPADLAALDGRDVLFRTHGAYNACEITVLDAAQLTTANRAELDMLKAPAAPMITPRMQLGTLSASADDITNMDVANFGTRSANFAFVRDTVPSSSPIAVAFSFDLFESFLGQGTLRADIAAKLAGHTPPELAAIRDQIINGSAFDAELALAVETALSMFEPMKFVRFTSSTNVPDTASGDVLSFDGCLADDQDQDAIGPSICDPTNPDEQGVYLALRKVFASFYDDSAVLERIRLQIPSGEVGVGVLARQAPSAETLHGNGKGLFHHQALGDDFDLVSQAGAVPYDHPSSRALAERVTWSLTTAAEFTLLARSSTLVPLGGWVMAFPNDYTALGGLVGSVVMGLGADVGATFDYEQEVSGALIITGLEPVTLPSTMRTVQTFMVDQPTRFCITQSSAYDVFSNHRLKSIWTLEAITQRMTMANVAARSIFDQVEFSFAGDTQIRHQSGDPAMFPGSNHRVEVLGPADYFGFPGDAYLRSWSLIAAVPLLVSPSAIPIVTPRDVRPSIGARYNTQMVPWIGFDGNPTSRMADVGSLDQLCADTTTVTAKNPRVEDTITAGGVTVVTSYYFPEPPVDLFDYTAPLYHWDQTTITGLTTEPIVLRQYWSQTFRAATHNEGADYIFEPKLEYGISPAILAELEAADIRYIVVLHQGMTSRILYAGLNGQTLREMP